MVLTGNVQSTSPSRGCPCASFKSAKDEILRGTRALVVCKGYEVWYLSSDRDGVGGGHSNTCQRLLNLDRGRRRDAEALRRTRRRVSWVLGSMCEIGGVLLLYTGKMGRC